MGLPPTWLTEAYITRARSRLPRRRLLAALNPTTRPVGVRAIEQVGKLAFADLAGQPERITSAPDVVTLILTSAGVGVLAPVSDGLLVVLDVFEPELSRSKAWPTPVNDKGFGPPLNVRTGLRAFDLSVASMRRSAKSVGAVRAARREPSLRRTIPKATGSIGWDRR